MHFILAIQYLIRKAKPVIKFYAAQHTPVNSIPQPVISLIYIAKNLPIENYFYEMEQNDMFCHQLVEDGLKTTLHCGCARF